MSYEGCLCVSMYVGEVHEQGNTNFTNDVSGTLKRNKSHENAIIILLKYKTKNITTTYKRVSTL